MTESLDNIPLQSMIDFLRRHAPFDQMEPAQLEWLAKRLNQSLYARGAKITDPESGPADRFIIIRQGRVRGESPDTDTSGNAWELAPGECFPIGALLGRRPVRTVHRAAEDCLCLELPREDFDTLLRQSPAFSDFCTRRLASLLDQVQHQIQAQAIHQQGGGGILALRVSECIRRAPVTCPPDTPIREALHTMQTHRIGSMIMTDSADRPLGLFTLHDLLDRVALPQVPLETAISEVMTPNPVSLGTRAYAFEAAMLMAEHGFGHVCIVERQRLVGVLSERDLFSTRRINLVQLSRSISQADTVASLARTASDIPRLVGQLIAQGAQAEQIGQMITLLNDRIARRVIELCIEATGDPGVRFAWLAFGSEGRQEQTLKTDQDNGILFTPPVGMSAEEARSRLLPLADRINVALAECGFALCPGNIMARNPECCLTAEEWQARFTRWIDQGTPEHLLKASIFFDFRVIEGDPAPVESLRGRLLEQTARNSRFRRQMAENALRLRPPLGLIRDFKVESRGAHQNTLDLKLNGVTPYVDAARIMALAAGVEAVNTVDRLQALADRSLLSQADVDAWIAAYHYIQLLRMRMHQGQLAAGESLSNHADPDSLNELDRRILKESFRQARKLQAKLAVDYQL
ncbi:MAG: DUF294 nucleotidyltransferase-like domain-containing protein [Halothiobacillaceae bacterium]